jgi:hypothetical protein
MNGARNAAAYITTAATKKPAVEGGLGRRRETNRAKRWSALTATR